MEPQTTRLPLGASNGSKSLVLAFAPTRSKVLGVRLLPVDRPPIPLESYEHGYFGVWDEPLPEGQIELEATFVGEAPQPLYLDWGTRKKFILDEEAPQRALEDLLRDRSALAGDRMDATSRQHAFFFELDRQTLSEYMQLERKVPERDQGFRKKWFPCLQQLLDVRLWQRHENPNVALRKCTEPGVTRHFSEIFWDAADLLFDPTKAPTGAERIKTIQEAMNRFAAGQLQTWLPFHPKKGVVQVPVSDPDSYFFFFFAEFATLAIETAVPRANEWRDLLGSLVDAQRYYVARHRKGNGDKALKRVTNAFGVPGKLEKNEIQLLARLPRQASAEAAFRQNLRDLGTAFGSAPSIRQECAAIAKLPQT